MLEDEPKVKVMFGYHYHHFESPSPSPSPPSSSSHIIVHVTNEKKCKSQSTTKMMMMTTTPTTATTTKRIECHMLVGADGIHSAVGKQLFGKRGCISVPQHITAYWGSSSSSSLPPHRAVVYHDYGVYFGGGVADGGAATWAAFIRDHRNNRDDGGSDDNDGGRKEVECGKRDHLLQYFAGWDKPVLDIINNTNEDQIVKVKIYDREPMLRWWKGRVIVIGDAAHGMTPFLGQGANMSISDALILSHLLYCNYSTLIHRSSQTRDRGMNNNNNEDEDEDDDDDDGYLSLITRSFADFEAFRLSTANWKIKRARMMANVLLSSSVILHYIFEILIFFVPEWTLRMVVVSYDVGNYLPSKLPVLSASSHSSNYYYYYFVLPLFIIFFLVLFAVAYTFIISTNLNL